MSFLLPQLFCSRHLFLLPLILILLVLSWIKLGWRHFESAWSPLLCFRSRIRTLIGGCQPFIWIWIEPDYSGIFWGGLVLLTSQKPLGNTSSTVSSIILFSLTSKAYSFGRTRVRDLCVLLSISLSRSRVRVWRFRWRFGWRWAGSRFGASLGVQSWLWWDPEGSEVDRELCRVDGCQQASWCRKGQLTVVTMETLSAHAPVKLSTQRPVTAGRRTPGWRRRRARFINRTLLQRRQQSNTLM